MSTLSPLPWQKRCGSDTGSGQNTAAHTQTRIQGRDAWLYSASIVVTPCGLGGATLPREHLCVGIGVVCCKKGERRYLSHARGRFDDKQGCVRAVPPPLIRAPWVWVWVWFVVCALSGVSTQL